MSSVLSLDEPEVGLAVLDNMLPTPPTLLYHEVHSLNKNAPWLVFIHGAGGSTTTWKRQPPDLAPHFNLLIVDLPGHGRMSGITVNTAPYSFEKIGLMVWDVVNHLGLEKVHLVGISLGTIITQTMILQYPQRVLSLINGGLIIQLTTKLKILSQTALALAKVIGYPAFYRLSARVMLPRKNHRHSREVFIRESKALSTHEFRRWTALYHGLSDTLKKLSEMQTNIPHLVIMGEQDHFFLKSAFAFAKKHKNVVIEVVPGSGHVVSIEKAKTFNELCIRYLIG